MMLRRYARKRSLPATLTAKDWQVALDYFKHSCAVCGELRDNCTLAGDHWIPISKGGGTTPDNIVPLCHGEGGCNNSKNATLPTIWLIWRYSEDKAAEILARIEAYFEWIKQQDN